MVPALDLGRLLVDLTRTLAGATVVGARDGDAGTTAGWPDEIAVGARERTVVDGVRVPGQVMEVEEHRVDVGTPGIDETLTVPPVEVRSQTVQTPEVPATVAAPPVRTPPVVVSTPPLGAETPPVRLPALKVATPPVAVPAQRVEVDASGADVQVQELHGTLYVGPAAVPYSVGPARAGASQLPPGVPQGATVETPAREALPSQTLLDEPERGVLPGQRVEVEGRDLLALEGGEVFPGATLGEIVVPAQEASSPGLHLFDGRSERVVVPSQRVASVATPAARLETPPVQATDKRVETPAVGQAVQPFDGVAEAGYVGYGRSDDSSLYPFACTAVVGCVEARHRLKPYLDFADGTLDLVADAWDRGIVVEA